MKRYLVFAGENYHPAGGMDDFIGEFDSVSEGKAAIIKNESPFLTEWGQIFDSQTMQIICTADRPNRTTTGEPDKDIEFEDIILTETN